MFKENPVQQNILDNIPKNIAEEIISRAKEDGVDISAYLLAPALDQEDLLEEMLSDTPKDLVARQISECKNLNLTEALEKILKFLELRSEWVYEGDESSRESVLALTKKLNAAKFEPGLFLGRGRAASVFQSPDISDNLCIKFLHTPEKQDNTLEREFNFLRHISDKEKDLKSLRVSRQISFAKNRNKDKSLLLMEHVKGLNLVEILKNPSNFVNMTQVSIKDMLDKLNQVNTISDLLLDLKTIHDSGLIHADIHKGNIMIDRDLNVYLIDFGNGYYLHEDGIGHEDTEDRKNKDINNFKRCLEELREGLTNIINNDILNNSPLLS